MRRLTLCLLALSTLLAGCADPAVWRSAVAQARSTGVVAVDARLGGDSAFCEDVRRRLDADDLVVCAPGAELALNGSLTLEPLRHHIDRRRHTTSYVAATHHIPNPEHRRVERRLHHAEHAVNEAETLIMQAKLHERDTSTLEELLAQRRRELRDVQHEHEHMPAYFVEEEHAFVNRKVEDEVRAEMDRDAALLKARAKLEERKKK